MKPFSGTALLRPQHLGTMTEAAIVQPRHSSFRLHDAFPLPGVHLRETSRSSAAWGWSQLDYGCCGPLCPYPLHGASPPAMHTLPTLVRASQQLQAECEEEAITLKLMRRLEQLKKEKAVLATAVSDETVHSSVPGAQWQLACIMRSSYLLMPSLPLLCRLSRRKVRQRSGWWSVQRWACK